VYSIRINGNGRRHFTPLASQAGHGVGNRNPLSHYDDVKYLIGREDCIPAL